MKKFIYKICNTSEWNTFKRKKKFYGTEKDLLDGYIHFSNRNQVKTTLKKHFFRKDNLILLKKSTLHYKNIIMKKSKKLLIPLKIEPKLYIHGQKMNIIISNL